MIYEGVSKLFDTWKSRMMKKYNENVSFFGDYRNIPSFWLAVGPLMSSMNDIK